MINYKLISLLMLSFSLNLSFAQERTITITIDDLPFVGTTHNKPGNLRREKERFLKIMQTLIDHNVPATGFVLAGSIEKNQWELLEQFHDEGFIIGNHTYSHLNLNRVDAERYKEDIARADKILTPLMQQGQKYFRYPYLAEGKGETKMDVQNFLANHDYIIAPVTIDSKDFKFNAQLFAIPWRQRPNHLERIKKQYLNYIWQQTLRAEKKAGNTEQTQILLIHANLLNSHFLGDVITMYKNKGYRFVSLDEALSTQGSLNTERFVSTIPPIRQIKQNKRHLEKTS